MQREPDQKANWKDAFIQGYKSSTLRLVIYYALCLCTFGILMIIKQIFPILWTKMTHHRCELNQASQVIIKVTFT